MSPDEREDNRQYKVVINHEEQYSIWPTDRDNPLGWSDEGMRGPRQACLDHISTAWKDMRPLSLRRRMEELAQHQDADARLPGTEHLRDNDVGDDLVNRLCAGNHPVELMLRPAKTREVLEHNLGCGCVHIKFAGTRGGTELDVDISPDRSASAMKDLVQGRQTMLLEGSLTLNYVNVRCVAEIETKTFTGRGRLELVGEGRQSQIQDQTTHGNNVKS